MFLNFHGPLSALSSSYETRLDFAAQLSRRRRSLYASQAISSVCTVPRARRPHTSWRVSVWRRTCALSVRWYVVCFAVLAPTLLGPFSDHQRLRFPQRVPVYPLLYAFDASPPRPIETRGAKSPAASTRRIQPLADKPRSRFGGSRLRSCGDRFCDQAPRIYGAKQLGRVQEFEPRLRGMSLEDRRGLFLITLSRKLILPDLGLLC